MADFGKFEPTGTFYLAPSGETDPLNKRDYTDSRGYCWFQLNTPFMGLKDGKGNVLVERLAPGYPGAVDLDGLCRTQQFRFTNSSGSQPCMITCFRRIEEGR